MTETWNLDQVAEFPGMAPNSADTRLREWRIEAVGREASRTGQNLYPADAVRAAKAARPGQGARTDLDRDVESD